MTPTGKLNILAALDIILKTGSLLKSDHEEARAIIEQITEVNFPQEKIECTAEPTSSE
jgi:hypothetical protein